MHTPAITIQHGFPEAFRERAALLYEEAFGPKMAVAVKDEAERLGLVRDCLQPAYCFAAMADEELVGLAGFHTGSDSFTGGIDFRDLLERRGLLKGVWASVIFSLYVRKPQPGELLMEGIAVSGDWRGKGVGGMLLEQMAAFGKAQGYGHVRLEVIDTNPRARQLYERFGFRAVRTENFPYLKNLLGFSASTTMHLPLAA